MIEITDAEQVERLNSRVMELLRERDALVKAFQQILDGSRNKEISDVEFRVRAAQAAHGALAVVGRGKET